MNALEHVKKSRAKGRPTGLTFIQQLIGDFTELHGDRRYGDDAAVVGGIGFLGDMPVTVVALEKGTHTTDKIKRNFGSSHPEGYRKALRLMKQAEKFRRPVLCIVDTAGAFCDVEAEERGQAQAIAENLMEMMTLKTPVIALLIGEGGSGGALGLAVADEVWMLENATYSVISPEGCAAILWKDSAKIEEAAECLKLTSHDLLGFNIVEKVIPETSFDDVFGQLRDQLPQKLKELQSFGEDDLLDKRYAKFRQIGAN